MGLTPASASTDSTGPTGSTASPAVAVLAIDAGNSKTDVALVAGDGSVLGSARGGGFQPPVVGAEAAVEALGETVVRAARDAGLDADAVGSGVPLAEHVSACLANADLPREERELAALVDGRGWGRGSEVANDTFAILRAGLPDDGSVRHGVAVVCGAGVNCVGVAEDGRGENTELARALPARFGLPDMYALIEAFHLGDLPSGRRHDLVPVLFEVADGGDAVARALVHRQAEEIAVMATVALERLGLLDTPTPVVLGGSVVAARHRLLHGRLLELFAERAPRADVDVITVPPVLGAALLALDRLAAGADACARLRAHHAVRG